MDHDATVKRTEIMEDVNLVLKGNGTLTVPEGINDKPTKTPVPDVSI